MRDTRRDHLPMPRLTGEDYEQLDIALARMTRAGLYPVEASPEALVARMRRLRLAGDAAPSKRRASA